MKMVKSDSVLVGRLPFILGLCVIRKDILSESIIYSCTAYRRRPAVGSRQFEKMKKKKKKKENDRERERKRVNRFCVLGAHEQWGNNMR